MKIVKMQSWWDLDGFGELASSYRGLESKNPYSWWGGPYPMVFIKHMEISL